MRLFIASSFPPDVTSGLNDRVLKVKTRLPTASWVKPETQHVTFAFLGEQAEDVVGRIVPDLEKELASVEAFDASLSGCGFFPNSRRARVGWIGLHPEEKFQDIAAAVRNVVADAGVELDRSEFRPHLTLMRIRDPWPPASCSLFESSFRDYRSPAHRIDHVTLYSSRLDPKGAVHTPLHEFRLR